MKLKSLVIALIFFSISFLFWCAITLGNEYTVEIFVPLKIINEFKDTAIDEEIPTKLKLKIKTSGWNIIRAKYDKDVNLVINLNNYQNVGSLNLKEFVASDFNLAPDVRIIDIKPSNIKLIRRKSFEKFVYIAPQLQIKTKDGFDIVSEININPSQILIRGTYNVLQKVDTIYTKPVILDEVSEDVNISVQLQDTLTNSTFYDKKNVEISFKVEQVVDKVFPQLPVIVKNIPLTKNVSIEPQNITLTLRGGIKVLSELKTVDIKIEIDYEKLAEQSLSRVKPEISVPFGIKLINYKPEDFLIKVN